MLIIVRLQLNVQFYIFQNTSQVKSNKSRKPFSAAVSFTSKNGGDGISVGSYYGVKQLNTTLLIRNRQFS